jgi:hypothetical protein
MSEMSDAGGSGFSVTGPDPLTEAAAAHACQAVFAAIAYGRQQMGAQVLRDLEPEHLAGLHVICGDVQIMVEAEQRRRGADVAFAAASARADAGSRERRRIADIASLTEAEDIIYGQALAATARGDRDSAVKLLRWCARTGIGESAWLLAVALEDAGRLLEAIPWYQCAASDGDERAAVRLARAVGPEAGKRRQTEQDEPDADAPGQAGEQ